MEGKHCLSLGLAAVCILTLVNYGLGQVGYAPNFLPDFDWAGGLSYDVGPTVLGQLLETNGSWQNIGEWKKAGSMVFARGGLGVAVVNGKIYAIGGSTEVSWPIFP
ncbi:MAG: hypothetical protein NWF09_09945, partial [Candidatus Bathyarchaeota archaeon]|nr:hypothetical protein [Candidatus Bathyarchaeota archaeon]